MLRSFPGTLHVTDDEVHVVTVDLDVPFDEALAILDDDERRQAARFHFERDRRRYLAAHSAFRTIVAVALGISPQAVRWAYHRGGKPFVNNDPGLSVSLSHSGERALVGFGRARDVGVDIERIRPIEVYALAEENFSPAEIAALHSRDDDCLQSFLRAWVAKEALLKARGDGLGGPLTAFDVSLEACPGEALVASRLADGREWSIRTLVTNADYVGAVAADGAPWRAVQWAGLWEGAACSALRT